MTQTKLRPCMPWPMFLRSHIAATVPKRICAGECHAQGQQSVVRDGPTHEHAGTCHRPQRCVVRPGSEFTLEGTVLMGSTGLAGQADGSWRRLDAPTCRARRSSTTMPTAGGRRPSSRSASSPQPARNAARHCSVAAAAAVHCLCSVSAAAAIWAVRLSHVFAVHAFPQGVDVHVMSIP